MRIATWNIERMKHRRSLDVILQECANVRADILVLTETDSRASPEYPFQAHTAPLTEIAPGFYRDTEKRVSIYSRYRYLRRLETCDPYTSLCIELETERGPLLVYGTIIGIRGNRDRTFQPDLERQAEDIRCLAAQGHSICFLGDFNTSFADNYYFTTAGREALLDVFADTDLRLLTGDRRACVDHIAVSRRFVGDGDVSVEEWNLDKRLSDHKGIAAEF